MFELQNKTISQKLAKELKKRARDHAKNGDGNFSKIMTNQKELPIKTTHQYILLDADVDAKKF